MATTSLQQALVRKVAYSVLIVALFTLSLLHRRLVVEPQGNALLLREVSQGRGQADRLGHPPGAHRLAWHRGYFFVVGRPGQTKET